MPTTTQIALNGVCNTTARRRTEPRFLQNVPDGLRRVEAVGARLTLGESPLQARSRGLVRLPEE